VEGRGLLITMDHLGESVGTIARADAATREYFEVVRQIVDSGIGRNISLKLTQLGLTAVPHTDRRYVTAPWGLP